MHNALPAVAVAITTDPDTGVTCALFTNIRDGADFAQLVCREMMYAFIRTYSSYLRGRHLNDTNIFAGFNVQIAEIIRNSVKPVINALHEARGVIACLLLVGDTIAHCTSDVDQVGLLAHYQALQTAADNVLGLRGDFGTSVSLVSQRTVVSLHRVIGRVSFVVMYKSSVQSEWIQPRIDKAVGLVEKILSLTANLQGGVV